MALPEEIVEITKKLRFITNRMESSIASHEFEKARFYSNEEGKERENLRAAREKYQLEGSSTVFVNRGDVEEVVSRWAGLPISSLRKESALTEPSSPTELPVELATFSKVVKNSRLRAFLCHSSGDKPAVRELYARLRSNEIDPWLDEENLLPRQEWDHEIINAVRDSHVVIVCLSANSVTKAGYLQKEIRAVLDVSDEQAEGTIYLIPLKLEVCEVPSRLRRWHWVNLFDERGFEKLMHALLERARSIEL